MKKHKDVIADINNNWELISLEKLCGTRIKEIQGSLSKEFGDLTFTLTRILFEDGSWCRVEGEHDFPYLSGLKVEDAELESIYKTNPEYAPSEDEEESE